MGLLEDIIQENIPHEEQQGAVAAPEDTESFEYVHAQYMRAVRQKALDMQNDPNFDISEADTRFSTALNLRQVRNMSVCIIGAGGLGNWQWRVLASMGFQRIIIYDDDTVGIENIGPQAHSLFDIGRPKVDAVSDAMLQYRGISVATLNKRAGALEDIVDDLGFCPDVIIGCTDSAAWRNKFISSLDAYLEKIFDEDSGDDEDEDARAAINSLPQLFIDFRMALGDYVCYVTPVRGIATSGDSEFMVQYIRDAVFPPEKAVHEACTERAISYTGANAAAYTGAVMHWWLTTGKALLNNSRNNPQCLRAFMLGNTSDPVQHETWQRQGERFRSDLKYMSHKMVFSARDWEFITNTNREHTLMQKEQAARKGMLAAASVVMGSIGAGTVEPISVIADFAVMPLSSRKRAVPFVELEPSSTAFIGIDGRAYVRLIYKISQNAHAKRIVRLEDKYELGEPWTTLDVIPSVLRRGLQVPYLDFIAARDMGHDVYDQIVAQTLLTGIGYTCVRLVAKTKPTKDISWANMSCEWDSIPTGVLDGAVVFVTRHSLGTPGAQFIPGQDMCMWLLQESTHTVKAIHMRSLTSNHFRPEIVESIAAGDTWGAEAGLFHRHTSMYDIEELPSEYFVEALASGDTYFQESHDLVAFRYNALTQRAPLLCSHLKHYRPAEKNTSVQPVSAVSSTQSPEQDTAGEICCTDNAGRTDHFAEVQLSSLSVGDKFYLSRDSDECEVIDISSAGRVRAVDSSDASVFIVGRITTTVYLKVA